MTNIDQKKNKKAFTLVEVVVVVAVIGLVLPALFSIVFSVLKQQVQLYYLTETKRQGDSALSTMENLIRPAVKITSDSSGKTQKCLLPERYPASGYSDGGGAFPFTSPIYFTDKDNNIFQLYLGAPDGNNIRQLVYKVNGGAASYLTTKKINVLSFQLACQRNNTYSPPTLFLIYTVQYNSTQTPTLPLTYRTRIVLRNQ